MRYEEELQHCRQQWAEGEWDNEPNFMKWRDPASGLLCIVRRHAFLGTLNGYVCVKRGHPFFMRHYSQTRCIRKPFKYKGDIPVLKKSPPRKSCRVQSFIVHGGVTFSGKIRRHGGGVERGWWFGFDCGHAWDVSPYFKGRGLDFGDSHYRNFDYVREQCAELAKQIAAAA
jgi:hypothetical protein